MRKTAIIVFLPLLLGVMGGFLALHFFSFGYIEKYLLRSDKSDLMPVEVTEVREIFIRENEAILEAVNRVERAVVGIKTETRTGLIKGSGLIVSSDGLIVTLNQVIPVGGDFNFFINGDEVSYEVIKRDADVNLALVRIEENNLPTLEFRDFKDLRIGESIFVVGAIFDENEEISKSVNQGIVKRINNYIKTNIFEEKKLLGSTLFDIEGKVLGLNLIDQRGEVYSIPVDIIKDFIGL